MLDNDYIAKNNITKDNVLDYVQNFKDYDKKINIRKMYTKENEKNEAYYIYGLLEKDNNNSQVFFIVYKDKKNTTCSILPISLDEFNQEIKNNQIIQEKEIIKNSYNEVKISVLTDEQKIDRIFDYFIHSEIYYPEFVYNELLNEDYKIREFGSIEKYKEYINENYNNLVSMDVGNSIAKYSIEEKDDYIKYTIRDIQGNYYEFDEKEPFNYKVLLDTNNTDLL